MFCAVVDDAGKVVGGLRAKALRSADDSHAVDEWAGQPGQQDVRQMIADRVPYGVLEMKAGWVTDAAGRNPFLTSALARSGFYMMVILDFQYLHVHRRDGDPEQLAFFRTGGGRHSGDALSHRAATEPSCSGGTGAISSTTRNRISSPRSSARQRI